MARYDFGGTLADFVITVRSVGGRDVLSLASTTLTFWSAKTGGTKYTDLLLNGSATSSISVGPDGQVPTFQGPDTVTAMWADGGAGRVRIVAQGIPGPAGTGASNSDIAGYLTTPGPAKDALTNSFARVYGVTGPADLQSQFSAAAATGGVLSLPVGTLTPTAALSVPPNLTKKVTIRGQGVGSTVVKLSDTVPRFIDLKGRGNDGDVYRNITVEDLTVDASAITANATHDGNVANHGIIGTMSGGVGGFPMFRVSLSDITIRRVAGVGGPTNTNTNAFFWIALASSVDSTEAQQTIQRILIEDVDLAGGDTGIYVGAFARSAGGFANVVVDDVTVRRWRHVLPNTPALGSLVTGNHVILGHHGIGRRGYIGYGYGINCGDVGIETDTWDDMLIEHVVVEDSANGCFYHTQFAAPLTPTAQRVRYRHCTAKRTNYSPASGIGTAGNLQGYGWWFNPNATYGRPAPATLESCAFIRTATDHGVLGSAIYADSATRLTMMDFLSDESQVVGRNVLAQAVRVRPAAGNTTFVRMHRCRFQTAGPLGTGAGNWNAVAFVQGQAVLDLDDITIEYNVTTPGATACRAIYLGDDSLSTTIGGTVRRARFAACSDASGWLIAAASLGTTTYQPRILVEDSSPRLPGEVNASTVGRTLVFFRPGSGAQQAYSFVQVRAGLVGGSRFPTVPIALTPSASPYTYQNQDAVAQRVVIQGGTVSQVLWSQDNTTFYDLGVTAGAFRLEGGDYLRVVYSAAPTMTKMHDKS